MNTGETFPSWGALLAWDNTVRSAGDDRVFQCPDCPSWASLGENARAHAFQKGHGLARLDPFKGPGMAPASLDPRNEPTCPCSICETPTPMLGTKKCNLCWSVLSGLGGMSPDRRMEIFSHFCTHCGSDNPRCQCWNDE